MKRHNSIMGKTSNKALKTVHFVHWDVQSVARFERPLAMR